MIVMICGAFVVFKEQHCSTQLEKYSRCEKKYWQQRWKAKSGCKKTDCSNNMVSWTLKVTHGFIC